MTDQLWDWLPAVIMHARCVRNATVSFLNTVAGYYRRPVDVQAAWTDRAGGRLDELLAAGMRLLAAWRSASGSNGERSFSNVIALTVCRK
jgi:hypothetical protein